MVFTPHPSPLPSREREQETIPESPSRRIRGDVGRLSRGLCEHVLRVEEIGVGLAEAHGIDVQKVRVAALLHDLARARRPEELVAMAEGFGIEVGEPESRMPIFPARAGGGGDGPGAVRDRGRGDTGGGEGAHDGAGGHGAGGAGGVPGGQSWTPSNDRRYPFNGRVREMASRDLDGAVLAFLEGEIAGREAGGGVVHPGSVGLRRGSYKALQV